MTPRAFALPALIAALLSGPTLAAAQEVVATARPTAGAPDVVVADADAAASVDGVISTASTVTGPPMTTDQKIANILSAARHADESDDRELSGPRQIHGTASVSVGTGGYRAASVSALMPVGENGMVGVAYAQSQGGRGFGYGPGFGPMGGDGVNRALGLSFSYDATKDGAGCRTTDQSLDAQRRARWAGHDDRPACRLRDD